MNGTHYRHTLLVVLASGALAVLSSSPSSATGCTVDSDTCSVHCDSVDFVNPSPSGDGQWVRILASWTIGDSLWGDRIVWQADGVEIGSSEPYDNGGGGGQTVFLTDQLRLTVPPTQEVQITGHYEGDAAWNVDDIDTECDREPVVITIEFTQTVVEDPQPLDEQPGARWSLFDYYPPDPAHIVFGEPATIGVCWDSLRDNPSDPPLQGYVLAWQDDFLVGEYLPFQGLAESLPFPDQPCTPDDPSLYATLPAPQHLGLGSQQILFEYLGHEGWIDGAPIVGVEVSRPRFSTGLRITPQRWLTVEGADLTFEACVTKRSGFDDEDPSGEVVMTSETMGFDETAFIGNGGCAEFEVTDLQLGTHQFDASYAGDDSFLGSEIARSVVVVPAQPTTPKPTMGRSRSPRRRGGQSPVSVIILHDNQPRAGPTNPPGVVDVSPSFHPQVVVAPEGGGVQPTGDLELRLNGELIGAQPLGTVPAEGEGQGPEGRAEPWLIPFGPYDLAPGGYLLEAAYLGDDNFAPAASLPVRLQVRQGHYRATNVRPGERRMRAFDLVARAYPTYPVAGKPISLMGSLVPQLDEPMLPGHPSGLMVFKADGEEIGRAVVNGFSGELRLVEAPPPGEYEITIEYRGSWSPDSWQSSEARTLTIYQRSSTTLATTARPQMTTGEKTDLVAYVYDPGEAIEPSGEVSFFDGTQLLGSSSLMDGRAEFEWKAYEIDEEGDPIMICDPHDPTDCELLKHSVGSIPITAVYSGDSVFTPSFWTFPQELNAPSPALHVHYAMAQFAEQINDPGSPLEERLSNDFDLELLELEERIEYCPAGGPGDVDGCDTVEVDGRISQIDWFFGLFGDGEGLEMEMPRFRSSFFLAKNDEVLVLVFRGTDGEPNEKANDLGEPGFWEISGIDYPIVAHPGWAYMTDTLYEGFLPADGSEYFEGIKSLVQAERDQGQALYIGGHSLGGALARMILLRLAADGLAQTGDRIYTFGSPWQGARNDLRCYPDLRDCDSETEPREFDDVYFDIVTGQLGTSHSSQVEGRLDRVPSAPDDGVREGYLEGTDLQPIADEINKYLFDWWDGFLPPEIGGDLLGGIGVDSDDIWGAIGGATDFFGLDEGVGFILPPTFVPIGYRPVQFSTHVFDIRADPDESEDSLFRYHEVSEYLRFTLDKLQEGDGKFYFPRGRNPVLYNDGVTSLKLRRLMEE